MKSFLTILLLYFITQSCEYKNSRDKVDKCQNLLHYAQNRKKPYHQRIVANRKALAILLNQQNDSLNKASIAKVAWNFHDLNKWDDLKKTSDILKIRSKEDLNYLAESFRLYGFYFENTPFQDSAFFYYSKAEKLFKNLGNDKELCHTYWDKAAVQRTINNYIESEKLLVKALKIAKKLKLDFELYGIYIDLGLSSQELNEFDKSLVYFNKALILANTNKIDQNRYPVAYCLNNIGGNLFYSGNVKKAISAYREALKNRKLKREFPLIYCRLIDNLGYAKLQLKQLNNLPHMFLESAKIRDSLNINQGKSNNEIYLSEYYLRLHDTIESIKYAQKSLVTSKEYHFSLGILSALKRLTKVDPKNALKYSEQYIRILDSTHQVERETRNKFAKIAFETEEIKQEKDIAVKQKSIFLNSTIAVTVLGILLFAIKTQRSRKKEVMFAKRQQKSNDEIYQLIQTQQSKIDEGRQIEKTRIARDLHDGVMNKLASTRFNLYTLKTNSGSENVKKCIPFIENIHDIEKEIRDIAHDLNSEVFSGNDSFKIILDSLLEAQKNRSKALLHIDIDSAINWETIESSKKVNIYRILQEALQNAGKHAQAENIFLNISHQNDFILVEVHDDGRGFSLASKKKGIGMQNMRSRAKDCGGIFHVESKNNKGTSIIVTIPIDNK